MCSVCIRHAPLSRHDRLPSAASWPPSSTRHFSTVSSLTSDSIIACNRTCRVWVERDRGQRLRPTGMAPLALLPASRIGFVVRDSYSLSLTRPLGSAPSFRLTHIALACRSYSLNCVSPARALLQLGSFGSPLTRSRLAVSTHHPSCVKVARSPFDHNQEQSASTVYACRPFAPIGPSRRTCGPAASGPFALVCPCQGLAFWVKKKLVFITIVNKSTNNERLSISVKTNGFILPSQNTTISGRWANIPPEPD
jgi:hypothetical protein